MFDKPFYKDWIFYLWLLSIVSIIPGTLASTKNGGGAGSFLIGVFFQTLLFLVVPSAIRGNLRNRRNLDEKKTRIENYSVNPVVNSGFLSPSNKVTENPGKLAQVRICVDCETIASESWSMGCENCNGTSFYHDKREIVHKVINPEFKKCPMCAEEIKFEAKKCRYCQHMLDFDK